MCNNRRDQEFEGFFSPVFLFWQERSKATSWPSWQDVIRKKLPALQPGVLGAVHARSHGPGDQENQPDVRHPDPEVPFRARCHQVTSTEGGLAFSRGLSAAQAPAACWQEKGLGPRQTVTLQYNQLFCFSPQSVVPDWTLSSGSVRDSAKTNSSSPKLNT